jgi:hypothetical protein
MKVQIQTLCESSLHLLTQSWSWKTISNYIIVSPQSIPSQFQWLYCFAWSTSQLYNELYWIKRIFSFEQSTVLSFNSTRTQHHKQQEPLYGFCLITMYWVGCLIGRTLQRGTTYDEPPSQWMKLWPYSNSPRDNHLDMAAGRISFKHELPKQLAYLVLHGKLPNEDISSTRLPLGTNKRLLCRRSATIKVNSKAWEALRWGSQCVW